MQKRTVASVTAVAAAGALAAGIVSLAQEPRVDDLVRADFFAGFAGRLGRAGAGHASDGGDARGGIPRNAAALVWHGAGTFFRSGAAFERGDFRTGIALWEQGLTEMARAVEMAPDDVEVLIPRGANLIVGSRFVPPAQADEILRTGVADFERVLELQAPYFSRLGVHCARRTPDRSRRRVESAGRPGSRAPLLRAHRRRARGFRVRAEGAGLARGPARGAGARLLRVLRLSSLTVVLADADRRAAGGGCRARRGGIVPIFAGAPIWERAECQSMKHVVASLAVACGLGFGFGWVGSGRIAG